MCDVSQTTVLKIEGMTCGHCQASVEKALIGVSGVTEARVNLDRKEAVVKGSVDREKLARAVEEAGYRVVGE
ncbi:CopZ family metallochaperone [Desulfitobacterium sp.]|uniref:CopZ family metallochaperone n=1 Tax=Desulfitobacterium sp. TaxID=49981 RepID=UPI002C5C9279|nr:cation transporter [Desulfitobacterium sp.]HVJ47702.1 cation transporter [Desulfitobacterium sp.]